MLVSGVIFSITTADTYVIIPSFLFAGIIGGVYAGAIRKRPMVNCLYDGFLVSLPASFLLSLVLLPVFWFVHGMNVSSGGLFNVVVVLWSGVFLLTGIVGGPAGGLFAGIYFRYLKDDRGEAELYSSVIEEKAKKSGKRKKSSDSSDYHN